MSEKANPNLKMYTPDDINKAILKKLHCGHPDEEYLGIHFKYLDEDYAEYKAKLESFNSAASEYKNLNKNMLSSTKIKLEESTEVEPKYSLESDCYKLPKHLQCSKDVDTKGLLIRVRSKRETHKETLATTKACCINRWFQRYLVLCKFINATRGIILKNRLLKNLARLRQLDTATIARYEDEPIAINNVSYSHLFEKFI